MPEPWQQSHPTPRLIVAAKIQDLVAARLGRGFLPLALLFLVGTVESVAAGLGDADAIAIALGSAVAAVAMLAYGLRIVQRAIGRPDRPWMSVAVVGGFVPLVFAVYVLGWRGLRLLSAGTLAGFATGVFFTLVGVWLIRSWMRIVEVERLAQGMAVGLDEELERA